MDAANPTSALQWMIPLFILVGVAKGLEIIAPSKRSRRSKAKQPPEDSALRARVAHLEKLVAAGSPAEVTKKSSGTGALGTLIEPMEFLVSAKRYFFSRQENAFYQALVPIAERRGYVVFSKVRLADIFEDAKGAPRGQSNYYDRMHIDYLLVTRTDFQPVAGIELNGPSHQNNEQQYRDGKKKAVFKAAKLPLLQFYNHRFTAEEIEQKLVDILGLDTRRTL